MGEVPLYRDPEVEGLTSGTVECSQLDIWWLVQGYLAHKKPPISPGPPYDPRHKPTVGP
jgi:hypothetical protein